MLELKVTNQFRKDYKMVKKRGYDVNLLENVIQMLLEEKKLPVRYREHELTGNYKGFRECHIMPDWLLIYSIEKDKIIFKSHSICYNKSIFKGIKFSGGFSPYIPNLKKCHNFSEVNAYEVFKDITGNGS